MLNKTDKKALQTIIDHTLQDIGYGDGGTYIQSNSQSKIHNTDIKLAQRGIGILIELIDSGVV